MKKVKQKYPHAVIATDIAIFTIDNQELKLVLIKMNKNPYKNSWAIPGSLIQGDESVDQGVKRTLKEKTGLENMFTEQLYTFGNVDRDPFGRVVSVAYIALKPFKGLSLKTTKEHGEIDWFGIKDLPELAYDHSEIIKTAVERLRSKLEYTNIVSNLLPSEFTMSDIQNVYEIILDKTLDKRNFRKKIESLQIIQKTGKKTIGRAHRPAELFKFTKKGAQTVQMI